MTVLTGETGAGKTALLGALKLLLGERADSNAVRSGAAETLVEGRFLAGGERDSSRSAASASTAGAGVRSTARWPPSARSQSASGRSSTCTGSTSTRRCCRRRRTSATSIGWAGAPAAVALAAYRQARAAHRRGPATLARARQPPRARRRRNADYLRFVAEEIDGVDSAARRGRGSSRRGCPRCSTASGSRRCRGGDVDAAARGRRSARRDRREPQRRSRGSAGIDPGARRDRRAARRGVRAGRRGERCRCAAYRDRIEHDPDALDEVLDAPAALAGLKTKYGPDLEDVLAARRGGSRGARGARCRRGGDGSGRRGGRGRRGRSFGTCSGRVSAARPRGGGARVRRRRWARPSRNSRWRGARFEVSLTARRSSRGPRTDPSASSSSTRRPPGSPPGRWRASHRAVKLSA